jgi:hypothetical protein
MPSLSFANPTPDNVERFGEILAEHGATHCKTCSAPITLAGCYSTDGQTEFGTDMSVLSVACPQCGADVVIMSSWLPLIDSVDEFLDELDSEWRERDT